MIEVQVIACMRITTTANEQGGSSIVSTNSFTRIPEALCYSSHQKNLLIGSLCTGSVVWSVYMHEQTHAYYQTHTMLRLCTLLRYTASWPLLPLHTLLYLYTT
jgi:hypothetical protein